MEKRIAAGNRLALAALMDGEIFGHTQYNVGSEAIIQQRTLRRIWIQLS